MTDNPYAQNFPMTPSQEKTWAVAQHLAAMFFEGLIPLIAYFMFRGRGPFITHHVKESLNFGLTMVVVAVVLILTFIGWVLLWLLPVYYVIFRLIAAYRASLGEFFVFPLTIRFIK